MKKNKKKEILKNFFPLLKMDLYFVASREENLPLFLFKSKEDAIEGIFTTMPQRFTDSKKKGEFWLQEARIAESDLEKLERQLEEIKARNLFYNTDFNKDLYENIINVPEDNRRYEIMNFLESNSEYLDALELSFGPLENQFELSDLKIPESELVEAIKIEGVWLIAGVIYFKEYEGKKTLGLFNGQFSFALGAILAQDKSYIVEDIFNPRLKKTDSKILPSVGGMVQPSGISIIGNPLLPNTEVPVFQSPVNKGPYNFSGWRNTANSCFLDSTLAAMFLTKSSNIYQYIRNDDSSWDEDVVELINSLRETLASAISGSRDTCYNFRSLFEKYYTASENFMTGTNDPSEFYSVFMKVIGKDPMVVETITMGAVNEKGDNKKIVKQERIRSTMLPDLQSEDLQVNNVAYPLSWTQKNWEYIEDWNREEGKYRKNMTRIVSADFICVHIFRGYPGANVVNDRRIPIDTVIAINDQEEGKTIYYELSSAVYSVGNNHYAALLREGNDWYNYDDTDPGNIQNAKGDLALAKQYLDQYANLLFYFPINEEQEENISVVSSPSSSVGSEEFGLDVYYTKNIFEDMVRRGELNGKDIIRLCGTNQKVRSWCTEDFYRRQAQREGYKEKWGKTWKQSFMQHIVPSKLYKEETLQSEGKAVHAIISDRTLQYDDGTFLENYVDMESIFPSLPEVGLIKNSLYIDYGKFLLHTQYGTLGFLDIYSYNFNNTPPRKPFSYYYTPLNNPDDKEIVDISKVNFVEYDMFMPRLPQIFYVVKTSDNEHYKFDKDKKTFLPLGIKTERILLLRNNGDGKNIVFGLDEKGRIFKAKFPRGKKKYFMGDDLYSYAYMGIGEDNNVNFFQVFILQRKDTGKIIYRVYGDNNSHALIFEKSILPSYPSSIKKLVLENVYPRLIDYTDILGIIFENGDFYTLPEYGKDEDRYENLFVLDYIDRASFFNENNTDYLLAKRRAP